ncbi:hypothetical protein HN51_046280, partial [Arachis hypogaea]
VACAHIEISQPSPSLMIPQKIEPLPALPSAVWAPVDCLLQQHRIALDSIVPSSPH